MATMNKAFAEETSLLLLKMSATLNARLAKPQRQCTDEEFEKDRRGFGCAPSTSEDDR
jgi:hypothetical protein